MSRSFARASSQYLNVAATPITGVPLTLACWFMPTDMTVDCGLLSITDAVLNTEYFILGFAGTTGGDPIQVAVGNAVNGSQVTNSTTGCTVNTWAHGCTVCSSSTNRIIYLNGGSTATGTTAIVPSALNDVAIGAYKLAVGAQAYMAGRIAEAAMWNVALSATEVMALAKGVSPLRIRPGNLLGYWPLYGVGSPEPNFTQGGPTYALTLVNTPTQADHAPVQQPFGYDREWQGNFRAAGGIVPAPYYYRLLQGAA